MSKNVIKNTLGGILLGSVFPLFSQLVDLVVSNGMSYSIINIIAIHQANPVHFIIDVIPVFAGITFYCIGKFSEKFNQVNENLNEQTQFLKEKNEEVVNCEKKLTKSQKDLLTVDSDYNKYKKECEASIREQAKEWTASVQCLQKNIEKLEVSKKQAESANKAKSRFLANLSHEIRTPLNAIVGFTTIIEWMTKNKEIEEELLSYLDKIKISSHNLSDLIKDVLDLAKIEAGKLTLNKEEINAEQLIRNMIQVNKDLAEQKKIKLTYHVSDSFPKFIKTDRTKMNQILMNLVTNAIKFTPEGKVHIKAQIKTKNTLSFKVIDTGIGIRKENIGKIFNSFEQADRTIIKNYGGTGLGLSITKNLVTLLGGKIFVESKLDEGSIFKIELPYNMASPIEKSETTPISEIRFPTNNKALLVENDSVNREAISQLLKQLNLRVFVAENAENVIEQCLDIKPNIVLMDIHMPRIDGFEATKTILNTKKLNHIPIIGLSANAFDKTKKKSLEAGMKCFLTKPVNVEQFIKVLQLYLN